MQCLEGNLQHYIWLLLDQSGFSTMRVIGDKCEKMEYKELPYTTMQAVIQSKTKGLRNATSHSRNQAGKADIFTSSVFLFCSGPQCIEGCHQYWGGQSGLLSPPTEMLIFFGNTNTPTNKVYKISGHPVIQSNRHIKLTITIRKMKSLESII